MVKKSAYWCSVLGACLLLGIVLTEFTRIFKVLENTPGTILLTGSVERSTHSGKQGVSSDIRDCLNPEKSAAATTSRDGNRTNSLRNNRDHVTASGLIDPTVHRKDYTEFLVNNGKVRNCISGQMIYASSWEREAITRFTDLSLSNTSRMEALRERKESFQNVFQNKLWGGERVSPQSHQIRGSGPGSTLDFSQEVIGTLHALVSALKEKLGKDKISLLDIPCGDMAWIKRFLDTREDVVYTGMDIVPEIIQHHRKQYGTNKRFTFINADILDANVTLLRYDLVFSRMMMQHLFDADVLKLLKKFSQSGSQYLLMTSFVHLSHNQNLGNTQSYRFRPQNLQLPPFSLTAPICLNRDGPPGKEDHYLGLWELPLLRVNNCKMKVKTLANTTQQFYIC